jgi:hypothetical protein
MHRRAPEMVAVDYRGSVEELKLDAVLRGERSRRRQDGLDVQPF